MRRLEKNHGSEDEEGGGGKGRSRSRSGTPSEGADQSPIRTNGKRYDAEDSNDIEDEMIAEEEEGN